MNKVNILVTGATGFIGGSVLQCLLDHPDISNFSISAVVRSADQAERLKDLGVNTTVGSHSDAPLMQKLAAKADVVFTAADNDNLGAATAILRGLKDRHKETGKKSMFIHTSGTGTLADDALGEYTYHQVYDDMDPDQIETLAPTQAHRPVDLKLVEADQEGYVDTYVILPSMIYGTVKNNLVELGIQNSHSIQLPYLVRLSIERGQAAMVGRGKNTWPHVHINDCADLYVQLYDAIVAGNPTPGHGYYFEENGHYLAYDLSKAIAVELAAHGIGTEEPEAFSANELNVLDKNSALGTNSRCKSSRARAIGWRPKYETEDMFASVKDAVHAVLNDRG